MDLSKIPEARKAGYSDTEIADFLAASNPKIKAARDAGYRDSEIIAHLAPKRSFGEKAVDFISDTADTVTGAVKKADHYFDTQVSKGLGGVAGMPRAAADAMEWVTQKTGMPMAGFGPLGAVGVVGKQMPTGDEL
ncbi:MAG TPA: hypothetical protein VEC14_17450, partial [Reyranellaceae bacterium]|nr:hypothetical protein [Reyranellaceae bacterium]